MRIREWLGGSRQWGSRVRGTRGGAAVFLEALEERRLLAVDLSPVSLALASGTPAVGATVRLEAVVGNFGNTAAEPFWIDFWMSRDTTFTMEDQHVGTPDNINAGIFVLGLPGNRATEPQFLTVKLPDAGSPLWQGSGTYYIGMSVDVDQLSGDDFLVNMFSLVPQHWIEAHYTVPGPAAPTGLIASNGTDVDAVHLAWNPAVDAVSFEVWRAKNDPSGASRTLIGQAAGTASTFVDSDVEAGAIYYYWLRAVNSAGTSGYSNTDGGFTGSGEVRLLNPAVPSSTERGEPYYFQWSGGGPGVTLDFWTYGTNLWQNIANDVPADSGSLLWDNASWPHGWYCVGVWIDDGGDYTYTFSPDWVWLKYSQNHTPEITLLSGNTVEYITRGDPYTIRWTYNDADSDPLHVALWAYTPDQGWFAIPGAEWLEASDGQFVWQTGSLAPGWYAFGAHIWDGSALGVDGSADFIHIAAPVTATAPLGAAAPPLTFTLPQGGTTVRRGVPFTVEWDAAAAALPAELDLWAYSPDADWVEVGSGIDAAANLYTWDTGTMAPGRYALAAWLNSGGEWQYVTVPYALVILA